MRREITIGLENDVLEVLITHAKFCGQSLEEYVASSLLIIADDPASLTNSNEDYTSAILSDEHFNSIFNDERYCWSFLEKLRWQDVVNCAVCGSTNNFNLRRWNYRYGCSDCRKHYNVLTNTIFQGTKMPLLTWFRIIYDYCKVKDAINSTSTGKKYNVTQRTSWGAIRKVKEFYFEGDSLYTFLKRAVSPITVGVAECEFETPAIKVKTKEKGDKNAFAAEKHITGKYGSQFI